MKMNVKRMAIAGFAIVALASAGRAASARTPAAPGNTPVTSSEATDTGGGSTAESDGSGGHGDPPGNVDQKRRRTARRATKPPAEGVLCTGNSF